MMYTLGSTQLEDSTLMEVDGVGLGFDCSCFRLNYNPKSSAQLNETSKGR